MKSLEVLFGRVALLVLIGLCAPACTKSGEDSNGSSGEAEVGESAAIGSGLLLSSQCGVVVDGEKRGSFTSDQAEEVYVNPLNSDLVEVRSLTGANGGGGQLVQLQGVTAAGVAERERLRGIDLIAREAGSSAYLLKGEAPCALTVAGGGRGIIGQLFSADGRNINELLLAEGAVVPSAAGGCGGEQLQACYSSIPVVEEFSRKVINNFLWKPVSDNDGNLVIGVDEFVTIKVSGALSETRSSDRFAGYPYITFVRFSRPGCSYGDSVRVEFYDEEGLRVKAGDGSEALVVPSGCRRDERVL